MVLKQQLLRALLIIFCCVLLQQRGESQGCATFGQCSGIVKSIDLQKKQITVRLKPPEPKGKPATAGGDEEIVYTFSFDSKTKVKMEDGSEATLDAIKKGSVITYSTNEKRADEIFLQTACTPRVCARSNCNRKCHSVSCSCPKD